MHLQFTPGRTTTGRVLVTTHARITTPHTKGRFVMPSFKTAFPSKYLKADDLGPTRPIVTIADVTFEDIGAGGKKERKLVASFREAGIKPLVLNLINCDSITTAAGTDDYEDWPGVRIQLFASKTEFQGKRVPCVRLCAPPPVPTRKAAAAAAPAEPEDVPESNDYAEPADDDVEVM
jgi:hypothetical protein